MVCTYKKPVLQLNIPKLLSPHLTLFYAILYLELIEEPNVLSFKVQVLDVVNHQL
jgi:hypothetical protein